MGLDPLFRTLEVSLFVMRQSSRCSLVIPRFPADHSVARIIDLPPVLGPNDLTPVFWPGSR